MLPSAISRHKLEESADAVGCVSDLEANEAAYVVDRRKYIVQLYASPWIPVERLKGKRDVFKR